MRTLTTLIYAIAITAALFTIPMAIEAATKTTTPSHEVGIGGSTLLAKKARVHKGRKFASKKHRKGRHKKSRHHRKAASRHGRKGHHKKVA